MPSENLTPDHRVIADQRRAERIPTEQRCKRCEGTGNQLIFMYQRCAACNGSGVSQGNEGDFDD